MPPPTAPASPPPRRLVVGAAVLALLPGGCQVLPDRPYVETRRFPLQPRRVAATGTGASDRAGRRKVLMLRLVRAAPGLEQRGLRTLRADGSVHVDFYNEWTAPPAELAEEAMRRWLTESGLFSAVTTPGSRAEPDLVLEMELTALFADLRDGGAARVEMSGVLLDGQGRVLAQLSPRGEVALPREATAAAVGHGDPPPEAIAGAIETALAEALAALERMLGRYA
jgi:ABC-type uncharacterized transport system auxiliary subunit